MSAVREDVSSGAKTDLLGANPVGYINYAPDGRMMVINVGGERPKPAAASATSAEAAALFRSMTSYAGTYTIDGDEITHHVDVSWNEGIPSWQSEQSSNSTLRLWSLWQDAHSTERWMEGIRLASSWHGLQNSSSSPGAPR